MHSLSLYMTIPVFSWQWWGLQLLLLSHTYFQAVGYHLASITGRRRETFGRLYAYRPWVQGILWLVMALTGSWPSLLGSFLTGLVFIALSVFSCKMSAYFAIANYAGKDIKDVENYLIKDLNR